MPQVSAEAWVPVSADRAFAVSQTTGAVRLRWDPFIRSQRLLDGAVVPAAGVRTLTRARLGPRMVSRYVSYRPPTSVGMTMVEGPWFFRSFGGGWRFVPEGDGCRAVWKYTYAVRPSWLRFVAEPVRQWLLGREIRRRIAAFAQGCLDPVVLAAADAAIRERGP
jgi:hypothetical protein